jgi:hypothetical protein
MNHKDIFEAIGATDEVLLEKSERKAHHVKKIVFAAVAACLAFVIAVGAPWPDSASTQHLICSDKINWSVDSHVLIKTDNGFSGMIPVEAGPAYQFAWAISVEARVLEVLPDTYSMPGVSTGLPKYHILRLKVLDEIIGTDLPKEIYYLLPETLDPDLTRFDSLIINMEQKGIEYYQMVNETTRQVEAFSFMFGEAAYAPDNGAVMAFTGGEMDMSLWDMEGWEQPTWYRGLPSTSTNGYPGGVGRSIKDTKQAIIQQAELFKKDGQYTFYTKLVTTDYFDWADAQEFLEYVKPFENGTFRQIFRVDPLRYYHEYSCASVEYERIINGFGTNERVCIARSFNGEHTTASRMDAQFTVEDMPNLPDMVSVINQIEQYVPEQYQGDAFEKRFCGVSGKYYKTDEQIYGVVTIEWGNGDYTPPKGPSCILELRVCDWTYILVLQDGTSRVVKEDELKSFIG